MTVTVNNIIGSDFWVNSEHLEMKDILINSRVPGRWSMFSALEPKFSGDLIKPINRYVSNLYPKPDLMSIDGNVVTLRQYTHAEIWVEPREEDLYALDKCWQRQFYPSPNKFTNTECFNPTYRFYMPWFPDINGVVTVLNAKVKDQVFIIKDIDITLSKKDLASSFIDVPFIDFKIKKEGPHMKTDEYGIIDIRTAMYDLVLTLNEEEIQDVRRQFG